MIANPVRKHSTTQHTWFRTYTQNEIQPNKIRISSFSRARVSSTPGSAEKAVLAPNAELFVVGSTVVCALLLHDVRRKVEIKPSRSYSNILRLSNRTDV